jgi:hypothetical protein
MEYDITIDGLFFETVCGLESALVRTAELRRSGADAHFKPHV